MTTTDPQRPAADECLEDPEDALLAGDRAIAPGTARAALGHRTFRRVYLGAFASNIGTWMQNVVLGAIAADISGNSGAFIGLVMFAQLAPLLVLSVVGGMLADAVDRRRLLLALTVEQAFFSLILALVVLPADPSKALLVLVTLAIGVGNALYAPVFGSVLPILVPRRDLPGAVSLNSTQMNASRVIGPAIGGLLQAAVGASWVFVLNAASYGAIIVVLLTVALPAPPSTGAQGMHRLLEGFRYARRHLVVARCLVVLVTFSLLCLPFITQLPKIAGDDLGIAPRSAGYGFLYAAFGLGAVVGSLSIGTVFARRSKPRMVRVGLVGFAVMLTVFSLLRAPLPAYPALLLLGGVYFAVITSLATVFQEHLEDSVRGKVMALWIMGFGGVVPFGGLAGGILMERFGTTPVMLGGAAVALALAAYARLDGPGHSAAPEPARPPVTPG